jgi:hypothetical protein
MAVYVVHSAHHVLTTSGHWRANVQSTTNNFVGDIYIDQLGGTTQYYLSLSLSHSLDLCFSLDHERRMGTAPRGAE